MKTFPLQSLTLNEAQQKQFALVDTICRHFPGSEFLTGGDLGLTPGLNQPRITQRVEQVLADAFHAPAAALVQGAGTGAIRAALAALLKPGQRLLVHDAPVYPTTRVIIEQMGLTLITADFNDLSALKQVVDEQQPDAALVQHTRQQPQDSYVLADVLATLRLAGIPALTDDNYAVMKVARIGCECGANVSTFSCFKLFGPEGVGAVVGDARFLRFSQWQFDVFLHPCQRLITFNGINLSAFFLRQLHARDDRFAIHHDGTTADGPDPRTITVCRGVVTFFFVKKLVEDFRRRSTCGNQRQNGYR